MKKQEPQILSHRFLGKLDNFENKRERNFEKKHLQAYLKGQDRFVYGRVELKDEHGNSTGMKIPKFHEVKQEYFMIDNPRYKK